MIPNVLIPMAGTGSRFRKAGYNVYKPFILIDGKPMIQHVLDAFPKYVKKYIIYTAELLNTDEVNYLKKQSDIVLCSIEAHKNGPAYSIWKAALLLPLDESFFVSYCDIFWTWDYEKIVVPNLGYDGIVFTRQAFHPHLVKDNFSAFCRPRKEDPTLLESIQEKKSFTDDWMNEPLSVGAFYFKKGHDMVNAIQKMIDGNVRVANEFFPSLTFNELVKEDQKVKLVNVGFFIHWGLPSQLNDFLHWNKVFSKLRSPQTQVNQTEVRNICCMGGLGARMKSLDNLPKALLPVEGKPMYQFVAANMVPGTTTTLLTVQNVIDKMGPVPIEFELVNLGDQTRSQFETLQRSLPILTRAKNFILSSCDALGFINFEKLKEITKQQESDAVIFTFSPSLLQTKMAGHHTFVSVEGPQVTEVHIKSKGTDSDLGLAGLFWFKDGNSFSLLDQTPADSKHEMCADHFLKYLVNSGRRVTAVALEAYVHLGTPEEYNEFQFWSHYTRELASKRLSNVRT